MFEPHERNVALCNSFASVHKWLCSQGVIALTTAAGTHFTAKGEITKRGTHTGESVIRFFQDCAEFGRAYECCWGHYYNCNRTRIGMYCEPLDSVIGEKR
jgi:hypothetical protein